jgi:hypothetical protein
MIAVLKRCPLVPRSYKYWAVPSSNPLGKKIMAYILAAKTLLGSDEFIAKMRQAMESKCAIGYRG